MSFATKYNKNGKIFAVNTEGWTEYVGLSDLYERNPEGEYPVKGFYINTKGKFGDRPTLISDGFFVNLPEHLLEDVQKIMANPADVADIDSGKVAFRVRPYVSKTYNKACFGVEYIDVE